jgi:hypothetical protein
MERDQDRPSVAQANLLSKEFELCNKAVEFQAVYIAGAQQEYLDALRKVWFIDNKRPDNPKDPENPAELLYHVSWGMDSIYAEKNNIKMTIGRNEAFFIASALLVNQALYDATGSYQTVRVPKLIPEYFRESFGETITFRQ